MNITERLIVLRDMKRHVLSRGDLDLIADAANAIAERDKLREALQWREGAPKKDPGDGWFIAETTYGEKVVLTSLPSEFTYDFKTADDTYIMRDRIARWMPFPAALNERQEGSVTNVKQRDRVWKIIYDRAGGHVHCSVFSADAPNKTYAKHGDLVIAADEFVSFQEMLVTGWLFEQRRR